MTDLVRPVRMIRIHIEEARRISRKQWLGEKGSGDARGFCGGLDADGDARTGDGRRMREEGPSRLVGGDAALGDGRSRG